MITSRQFKSALIAALIFAASAYPGRAQPVPQAPAGSAVPVTADNFNRGYLKDPPLGASHEIT
jgi:hypothetical protein